MAQYINKSDLIAEIERLIDKGKYHEEYYCAYRDGNNSALYALKEIINTLEVKEVDSTDVFIEKVVNFLEILGYAYTITDNITKSLYDNTQLIEDFKSYMEE